VCHEMEGPTKKNFQTAMYGGRGVFNWKARSRARRERFPGGLSPGVVRPRRVKPENVTQNSPGEVSSGLEAKNSTKGLRKAGGTRGTNDAPALDYEVTDECLDNQGPDLKSPEQPWGPQLHGAGKILLRGTGPTRESNVFKKMVDLATPP